MSQTTAEQMDEFYCRGLYRLVHVGVACVALDDLNICYGPVRKLLKSPEDLVLHDVAFIYLLSSKT